MMIFSLAFPREHLTEYQTICFNSLVNRGLGDFEEQAKSVNKGDEESTTEFDNSVLLDQTEENKKKKK